MHTFKLFILFFLYNNPVFAELDEHSQKALDQTVKAMTNSQERAKAFKENPRYQEGEAGADMLVKGNEAQKEQIYEIAAKVLEDLAKKSNGDPEKMQELVQQGSKNPSQFIENNFSEAQKQQVKALAAEIEKSRTPSSPQPSK